MLNTYTENGWKTEDFYIVQTSTGDGLEVYWWWYPKPQKKKYSNLSIAHCIDMLLTKSSQVVCMFVSGDPDERRCAGIGLESSIGAWSFPLYVLELA